MHRVDKPFDMTQLSDESESWLTKTTERLHIAFNDEWFQFDYYVDHAPKNPKVKPLPVFVEMFTAMTFARRKRVPRELDRAAGYHFCRILPAAICSCTEGLPIFRRIDLVSCRTAETAYGRQQKCGGDLRELLARCRYTTAYGPTGSHMTAILGAIRILPRTMRSWYIRAIRN